MENENMKKPLIIVGIFAAVILLFFLFNSYAYKGKHERVSDRDLYFQQKMLVFGAQDIGQPIEGFDANLLIKAFPGLVAQDFDRVETFEGRYEIRGGEAVFVRGQDQPISSAESTVSEKGFATLLKNLSFRLKMPVGSESEIDSIVDTINTGERLIVRIDLGGSALGIKIVPQEVLEDSRCPIDVVCIQAGTVRVRSTLERNSATTTEIFKLNEPLTTDTETITLTQVDPPSASGFTIKDTDYVFYFQIKVIDPRASSGVNVSSKTRLNSQ